MYFGGSSFVDANYIMRHIIIMAYITITRKCLGWLL